MRTSGKKRCTKGKSCGSTCISRSKLCVMETGKPVAQGLQSLKTVVTDNKVKDPFNNVGKPGSSPNWSGKQKDGDFARMRRNKELKDKMIESRKEVFQLGAKVNDAELKRRERELAKKFKEENGRSPKKSEREKIKDQAMKEQIDALRKRQQLAKSLQGRLNASAGGKIEPVPGPKTREGELIERFKPKGLERRTQQYGWYGGTGTPEQRQQQYQAWLKSRSDSDRAESLSYSRAAKRVAEMEKESGKALSGKELRTTFEKIRAEEFGKALEEFKKVPTLSPSSFKLPPFRLT